MPPALSTALDVRRRAGPSGCAAPSGRRRRRRPRAAARRTRAPSRGAASRRPGHDLEDRHVPHAVVAGAVVAGDTGAVEHEGDAALVQRDVHQHLVEGPVEEGRVDRHDRVQPAHRQAGGAGDGVLLGDADVEGALGVRRGEAIEADRVEHRRRDRDDVLALGTEGDHLLGEEVGPDAALRRADPGLDVERPDLVELVGLVALGRVVAEALAGDARARSPGRRTSWPGRAPARRPRGRARRSGRRTSGRGPRRGPAGRARPSCPSSSRAGRRRPPGRRRGRR